MSGRTDLPGSTTHAATTTSPRTRARPDGTAGRPRRPAPPPPPEPDGPTPDGPVILIRPVHSARPGTMPAGLVLMVVVVGLFAAMLLNAPATLRKSKGDPDNPAWRTTVAEGVAGVSGFFGLDVPRERLDEALGKNQTTDADIDEVVAEAEVAEPIEAEDPTPTLRVPTAADPLRLYVGGDSMANGLAASLVRSAEATGLVDVVDGGRVSSGLARPDFYNWPQVLARDIDPQNAMDPDVVVLQFGANDLQNIPLAEGGGYELGSASWLGEYRRRVAGVMDILNTPDHDRVVLWVGLPVMGPRSSLDNRTVDQVNRIYWEEAQTRPWVEYVDSWSYFTAPDGSFAEELPFADGEVRRVRHSDDIHMQVAGYDRLGWAVMAHLLRWADLSAAPPAQPPSETAPAEVTERPEPAAI